MQAVHNIEAQQVNFADERFYTLDGQNFYPSCTEILSLYPRGQGFANWLKHAGRNADLLAERAAETGSRLRQTFNELINGAEIVWTGDNYTLDEWKMICRFMEWWQRYTPQPLGSNLSLCSETLGYGGTIDLVCETAGRRWLISFRTGATLYTGCELKTAAYAMLWNEANPMQKVDTTGILWLKTTTRGEDKKGQSIQGKGWQLKTFSRPFEDAFRIFSHTHEIWKEENPGYKPANLILPDRFRIQP